MFPLLLLQSLPGDRCLAYCWLLQITDDHLTDMAVLKVLGKNLCANGSGALAVLMLLDLFAAFGMVDHATLLRQLRCRRNRFQLFQRMQKFRSLPKQPAARVVQSATRVGPRSDSVIHTWPT